MVHPRSRAPRPLRLGDVHPDAVALEVADRVLGRAVRDLQRLAPAVVGMVAVPGASPPVAGHPPDMLAAARSALRSSRAYLDAFAAVEWAQAGKGSSLDQIDTVLEAFTEDIDGPDVLPLVAPLEHAPHTALDLVRVAAQARLQLYRLHDVTALDLATLAGVDERTIRADASAGRIKPRARNARPMRFAPLPALVFLAWRKVPGIAEVLSARTRRLGGAPDPSTAHPLELPQGEAPPASPGPSSTAGALSP